MYEQRIRHLEEMHRKLDTEISKMEKNHPHVDEARVHDMKKQKLHIKDELSQLRRRQFEATSGRETEDWGDDR